MTKKKKGSKSKSKKGRSEAPLTDEQLFELKDIPASKRVPRDIQNLLSATRRYVHSREPIEKAVELARVDDSDTYTIELPRSAQWGAPGRTGRGMTAGELAKVRGGRAYSSSGYCPPWVDRRFRAPAARMQADPMGITPDGTVITPHADLYLPEDRQPYRPSAYPECSIGRLFALGAKGRMIGAGTGVLVGPRHVLTVAHNCPWNEPVWGMQFFPAFFDGVSAFAPQSEFWVSDWRALANVTSLDAVRANDLAMLRLYEPAGEAFGWFGAKVHEPGWMPFTWRLNGYPSAVAMGMRPSAQTGIPVLARREFGDGLELLHRADATRGNSGSPLWHFWGDNIAYAVGVQSAGRVSQTEDVNVAGGGLRMVNLINFWRTQWA